MNGNNQRTNDDLLRFHSLSTGNVYSVICCSMFVELFTTTEACAVLWDNNRQP